MTQDVFVDTSNRYHLMPCDVINYDDAIFIAEFCLDFILAFSSSLPHYLLNLFCVEVHCVECCLLSSLFLDFFFFSRCKLYF